MAEWVFDATVIGISNTDLRRRRRGNALDRRLVLIENAVSGVARVRYNRKLLGEYQRLASQYKNDVIELFFAILDSGGAVLVGRNTLSRQEYSLALACRWPSHDQHLLAAAVGGAAVTVFVTEARHVQCASKIRRNFAISIQEVS
jgi:hypothetical protein